MRPALRRIAALLLVALVGLVAGVLLASCGGDDESSPTTTTTTTDAQTQTTSPPPEPPLPTVNQPDSPTVVRVVVANGVPKGGIVRRTVNKGDRVVLVVKSDVADEVHLHGYDLSRAVAAGGTARIRFRANVPGRFEVELEERGVPVADLTVKP